MASDALIAQASIPFYNLKSSVHWLYGFIELGFSNYAAQLQPIEAPNLVVSDILQELDPHREQAFALLPSGELLDLNPNSQRIENAFKMLEARIHSKFRELRKHNDLETLKTYSLKNIMLDAFSGLSDEFDNQLEGFIKVLACKIIFEANYGVRASNGGYIDHLNRDRFFDHLQRLSESLGQARLCERSFRLLNSRLDREQALYEAAVYYEWPTNRNIENGNAGLAKFPKGQPDEDRQALLQQAHDSYFEHRAKWSEPSQRNSQNQKWVTDFRDTLQKAFDADSDKSLWELIHGNWTTDIDAFVTTDLWHSVLDDEPNFLVSASNGVNIQQANLEECIHYDYFRNFSWRTSQKPQSLHLLPLCSLVKMNINDNHQAWIEYLYPLAPGDDYPFPVGQSKAEQTETIKKFRDRTLYWSNDGEFKRPEIIAWVQESWDNLQYAVEHASSLSLQEIIQTFPTDYVKFDKTLSTLESNRRQLKQQAMNDIARRALLYKLFKSPPPNIISNAQELAEIKREVEKVKAQLKPVPTTLPVDNSSHSLSHDSQLQTPRSIHQTDWVDKGENKIRATKTIPQEALLTDLTIRKKSLIPLYQLKDRLDYRQALIELSLDDQTRFLSLIPENPTKVQQDEVIRCWLEEEEFKGYQQGDSPNSVEPIIVLKGYQHFIDNAVFATYSSPRRHELPKKLHDFKQYYAKDKAFGIKTGNPQAGIFSQTLAECLENDSGFAAFILAVEPNFPEDLPEIAETIPSHSTPQTTEVVKDAINSVGSASMSFYVAYDDFNELQVYFGQQIFLRRGTGQHDIVRELIRLGGVAEISEIAQALDFDEDQITEHVKKINSSFKRQAKSKELLIKTSSPKLRLCATLRENRYPAST